MLEFFGYMFLGLGLVGLGFPFLLRRKMAQRGSLSTEPDNFQVGMLVGDQAARAASDEGLAVMLELVVSTEPMTQFAAGYTAAVIVEADRRFAHNI